MPRQDHQMPTPAHLPLDASRESVSRRSTGHRPGFLASRMWSILIGFHQDPPVVPDRRVGSDTCTGSWCLEISELVQIDLCRWLRRGLALGPKMHRQTRFAAQLGPALADQYAQKPPELYLANRATYPRIARRRAARHGTIFQHQACNWPTTFLRDPYRCRRGHQASDTR